MKTLNKIILSLSALLLPVAYAYAQWRPSVLLSNPAPGAGSTMQDFIGLLIRIMQLVGIPLLVVCIIYSGFLMVTAGENEAQVTKAKAWIFWTLVGAAIILGAHVLAGVAYGTAALF